MATLSNFNITSAQNQNILIYSNGEWINTSISAFYGALDGRYATNTHNHNSQYMAVGDAYLKAQTYPAASLYTRAEIDSMFSGYTPGTGGGGGGAVDGATNIGSGSSVFSSNVSGILEFRKITTDNLNLLEVAVSGNSIVLSPKAQSWSTITGRPSTFTPSAHNHSAGNITSGVFSRARLGSGTANSGTFLRGDGTWASIDVSGDLDWNNISGKPELPVVALTQPNSVLTNSSTLAPGFYSTSEGLPNAAGTGVEESSWWHVLNFKHKASNGYGAQLALELSSSTDAKLQFRTSGSSTNGDTWTNWYKVYSEQYKPTLGELGAAAASHGHAEYVGKNSNATLNTLTFTPRGAGKYHLLKTEGEGGLWQASDRGALMLTSSDDALILANGDVGRKFNLDGSDGIDPIPENMYLVSDSNIVFKTDLQEGFGSEHTFDMTNTGLLRVNGNTVYHEGRKPTLGELGAAATSHTHDSHEVKALGNRLTVDSDGKIRVNNTAYRAAGMYGIYDSNKIGHIWSMGSGYSIDINGANFGNLYGLAYKHTNNPTGGTMGGGHQMVWTSNGNPTFAAGSNVWTSGIYYGNGSGLTSVNADRVDGLHAGDFLRSNASDNFNRGSGVLTFDMVGGERATSVSSRAPIEIRNSDSAGDAFMQFHIANKYATYFGLDRDTNDLFVGGYSMGDTRNRIWHDGNRTKFSPGTAFDLGEQDLNGFNNDDAAGFYFQQANARTDGNNYPVELAGSLLVQKSAQSSNIGSTQLYITYNNSGLYFRGLYGNTPGWRKVWFDGNDGAGSGLDADKLDGLQASDFLRSNNNDTFYNTLTIDGRIHVFDGGAVPNGSTKFGRNTDQYMTFMGNSGGNHMVSVSEAGNPKTVMKFSISTDGGASLASTYDLSGPSGKIWTSGNDGSGSGLDADLVRGYSASDAGVASTVVIRNGSGDINARLFRSTYNSQGSIPSSAAVAFRVNNSNDNFIRFANQNGLGEFAAGGITKFTNKIMFAGDGNLSSQNANLAISIGDADTGIRWNSDGNIDLMANNIAVANITNSKFKANVTIESSGNVVTNNHDLYAGDGKGVRFWGGSNSYKIYMSGYAGSEAGRIDPTSDYNMYFRMGGGTNRGFVFKNGNTNFAHLTPNKNYFTSKTEIVYSGNDVEPALLVQKRSDIAKSGAALLIATDGEVDDILLEGRSNSVGTDTDVSGRASNSTSGDMRFQVWADGSAYFKGEVSTSDTKARSDIRVKRNLSEIDNALSKVNSLTGFTYDEINLNKRMASVIAQDVQKVLPEAVGEDREGMLNVSPMALIGLLVNAVKELSDEVKELKNGNL